MKWKTSGVTTVATKRADPLTPQRLAVIRACSMLVAAFPGSIVQNEGESAPYGFGARWGKVKSSRGEWSTVKPVVNAAVISVEIDVATPVKKAPPKPRRKKGEQFAGQGALLKKPVPHLNNR